MAGLLAHMALQMVTGVVGGRIVGAWLRQARDERLVGIVSGGIGGLGLGLLVGGFIDDIHWPFALLSDVGLGLAGGALATAIVLPARKRR